MRPKEKVEGTIHSAGLTALQTSAVAQLWPEAPAARGCSNEEHEGCFRSAWLRGAQGAAVPPRPLAQGTGTAVAATLRRERFIPSAVRAVQNGCISKFGHSWASGTLEMANPPFSGVSCLILER